MNKKVNAQHNEADLDQLLDQIWSELGPKDDESNVAVDEAVTQIVREDPRETRDGRRFTAQGE